MGEKKRPRRHSVEFIAAALEKMKRYRGAAPPVPPSTPLSATTLLMNALDEPRLGFELERELATADRVFMVVSFVRFCCKRQNDSKRLDELVPILRSDIRERN